MVVMDTLDSKLNEFYAGKVVRKDLTKSIKEGANVPRYRTWCCYGEASVG